MKPKTIDDFMEIDTNFSLIHWTDVNRNKKFYLFSPEDAQEYISQAAEIERLKERVRKFRTFGDMSQAVYFRNRMENEIMKYEVSFDCQNWEDMSQVVINQTTQVATLLKKVGILKEALEKIAPSKELKSNLARSILLEDRSIYIAVQALAKAEEIK